MLLAVLVSAVMSQAADATGRARPSTPPSGPHAARIGVPVHVRYNGKCLGADVNRIWQNGTRVQLWDCNWLFAE